MKFDDLKGKRIGILGLGREGQAVWRQIRQRFPTQEICFFAESKSDDGFIEQLDPDLDRCSFGPFERDQLVPFDILVRSAGISPYREVLTELRTLGVKFTTANSLWFAENPGANTICITGTKGKSTTAALIAHLINCAGFRACLSGNIGRPMLDYNPEDVDWWVIELSSYQLSDLEAQPDFALLLNLSHEHVDWHGSVENYRADKLRLATLTKEGGLIANHADPVLLECLAHSKDIAAVTWFNDTTGWRGDKTSVLYLPSDDVTAPLKIPAPAALPGEHNMHNLAAALTVLDAAGVECLDVSSALASFRGLPHRLQRIGRIDGVRYIDDSISTTPVSVSAALKTLGAADVVLLLGGMERGLSWDEFASQLGAYSPHTIITMPDNGPLIFQAVERVIAHGSVELPGGLHAVANLQEAVKLAQQLVPVGGCVLLSPGAPSFPHFRDFEDRGIQFGQLAGILPV